MARTKVVHHIKGYVAIEKRISDVGFGVATAVQRDAVTKAPVDTGALAASIRVLHPMKWTWHVEVGTDHWAHQEYGTLGRDPIIVPRVKEALWWPGLPHPIARVDKHPGNKPQPFMRPATYQRRAVRVNQNTGYVRVLN